MAHLDKDYIKSLRKQLKTSSDSVGFALDPCLAILIAERVITPLPFQKTLFHPCCVRGKKIQHISLDFNSY
jgi:hypothetical protein